MTASSGGITADYRRGIDRLMWFAALAHLLLCLAVGLNGSWPLTLAYALIAAPLAWLATRWQPGTLFSGFAMAALLMGFSALLIEQTGGLIEAHFSVFIMLCALMLYGDGRVIAFGVGVIAVHHAFFTYLQYRGGVHLYGSVAATHGDVRLLLTDLSMHFGAMVGQALVLGYLARHLRRAVVDNLDFAAFAHATGRGVLKMDFTPAQRKRAVIQAVARMQLRLSGVLADVRHATDEVRVLSADTCAAQQRLHAQSRRSAEQIGHIAAATEQLSVSTRESAAKAEHTNALAARAGRTVEESAEGMSRLNDTMTRIDESAGDIATLLAEIDNITFQTNLLALNASVEAARAGDQGRGFAVVANEVRQLSQRSATAAQSIRAHVQRSNQQAEAGVEQVRVAAEHMQDVVEAFCEILRHTDEISTASQQQHEGIATLATGIAEMQEALSLSARAIERSRDDVVSLASEADRLAGTLGYFELDTRPRERRHRQRPPKAVATESLKQGIMPV